MAEVKWIKLIVGMFDGKSFKKIKRAKIGGESYRDKLTAIWFELMDFAGKCNHSGAFVDSHEIPFANIEDIAIMIDRDVDELQLCMTYYINEGMIEIVDDVYMLSNWSQYQNETGLAEIREYNRLAKQKSRAKQKLLQGVNDKSRTSQECQGTDIDKETETEEEEEEEGKKEVPSKPTRHKYGRYNNVLLSDEDYQKLQAEFPHDYSERIERLSEYIASTGKSYKSHLATIRMWARKDQPNASTQRSIPQASSSNPFLELAMRQRGEQ